MNPLNPLNPFDDGANRWRNLVAAAAVGGGILVSLLLYHLPVASKLTEVSLLARHFETLQSRPVSGTGGDIVVPHTPPPPTPIMIASSTTQPTLTAVSFMVKDIASGKVLAAKDEYTPRPIASLTKLMSALILADLRLDWATTTQVAVDEVIDTHMYAGDTYTIDDLWHAALVGSSNKAVLSLVDASSISREAFVERMNVKARTLGMTNTTFVEPTGLDERNVSTASDVAILLHEVLQHDTIRDALLTREYTLFSPERTKEHHLWSTNWLMLRWIPHTFDKILGGKTGYIVSSGYNFAVETEKDGHQLTTVILGATVHEDRFTDARAIAEWVYENYAWPIPREMATPPNV